MSWLKERVEVEFFDWCVTPLMSKIIHRRLHHRFLLLYPRGAVGGLRWCWV